MSSYWTFANDLETRLCFLVASLPLLLAAVGVTSKPRWLSVAFYMISVVAVWLTNRCFTPPKTSTRVKTPLKGGESPVAATSSSSSRPAPSSLNSRVNPRRGLEEGDSIPTSQPAIKRPEVETRRDEKPKDNISFVTTPLFLWSAKSTVYLIGFYHSLLALYFPSSSFLSPLSSSSPKPSLHHSQAPSSAFSTLCPHSDHLNSSLFTFTPLSVLALILITSSSLLRLLAFHQLGRNFTFDLRRPSRLVMTGLYAWMQHPSYTFGIVVVVANTFLYERFDGVACCWVGGEGEGDGEWFGGVLNRVVSGWGNGLLYWVAVAVGVMGAVMRIRDEEVILRREFGGEWEVWHERTARLVPGCF